LAPTIVDLFIFETKQFAYQYLLVNHNMLLRTSIQRTSTPLATAQRNIMSYGGRRNHDPWNDSYRSHYGGGYGGGKSHGNSYGGSGSNDARDYYYNDRGDNYAVPKQERSEYSDPGSSSYYQPQRREYHSGSGARRTWSPSRPNSRSPDFGSSDYGGGAGASSGFARRSSPTYSSPPHRPWGAGGAARRARKEHFVPHLPPAAYIELSREEPTTTPEPSPKLLVLDLNGALLYRSENKSAAGRVSYPRPFLHNFLAYLMTPEPSGEASPYEVLVWSSAQPQNVRVMVETTFGPWCDGQWGEKPKLEHNEKRLLDVWARDKMNLGGDYRASRSRHR
jgi:hypothetical protein